MHEIRSAILGDSRQSLVARKARKADAGAAGLSSIAIRRQEARLTDQRLEDRHFNILDEATMVFRRKKLTVAVVNVSSRGAMLRAAIEPRIGEKVEMLFTPQTRTRCAVRWVRDGRIGVEFLDETIFWKTTGNGPVFRYESAQTEEAEIARPAEFKDRAPRQRVMRCGTLYWGGVSIPVRLRNISEGGARLESDRILQPGCEVELDLGDAGFRAAEVRWSTEGQVGLRFFEEFDLDSLTPSELATERPPEVLKPAYLDTELQPDSPWAARFERLSMTELRLVEKKQP